MPLTPMLFLFVPPVPPTAEGTAIQAQCWVYPAWWPLGHYAQDSTGRSQHSSSHLSVVSPLLSWSLCWSHCPLTAEGSMEL